MLNFQFTEITLAGVGYSLPAEIVRSDEIEERLRPLYDRLRLSVGRLELMTGIRERRIWPEGTLPGDISVASARQVMNRSGIDPREIGVLIHASVCRDYLEPATASGVHHRLGLRPDCLVYDVSNACLGILDGMLQVANMIELGQVTAGLVVGTESSRPLLENTIRALNADQHITRAALKPALASLTIGSASAAVLLAKPGRHLGKGGYVARLRAAAVRADTRHHRLCHSGADEAVAGGMSPLMLTDAEALLHAGVGVARETFADFLKATRWRAGAIDKTCCHQVGAAHRKLLLDSLGIPAERDYSTFEWLGNTGSVALPITAALAAENGHLKSGDRVAWLGIGSGINVVMLGLDWF